MAARVFPQSNNVVQDQAKILFDFYLQAAEQIVAKEEKIEQELQDVEKKIKDVERSYGDDWILLLLFVLIIPIFIFFARSDEKKKRLDKLFKKKEELKAAYNAIFRDYRISKMGVLYVPVAKQVLYNENSFIIDCTGSVPTAEITLQVPRQSDLLVSTMRDLEAHLDHIPLIERSDVVASLDTSDYSTSIQSVQQFEFFGTLDRHIQTLLGCIGAVDTETVSLPLVMTTSNYHNFLHEYATTTLPSDAIILDVFDQQRYSSTVEKFKELTRLRDSLSSDSLQFEEVLRNLMQRLATRTQELFSLKAASVEKVVSESNNIFYEILKAPYNHYSPQLEFEEIERIRKETFDYNVTQEVSKPFSLRQSSRVRYNLVSNLWTAEDGSTTASPFGVHQIYEEIVAPIVTNLLSENRLERLKIYNHIQDQKLSYLNKWHQDTDSFYRQARTESSDLINIMQETLREYIAAYTTLASLQKTEMSMKHSGGELDSTVVEAVDTSSEALVAFKQQAEEFEKIESDFEAYILRLKEDIDEKAERFAYIEFFDAKLRDGYSNELAIATEEIRDMDERRRRLAFVNPLLAKKAALPPVPQVEERVYEKLEINLPALVNTSLEALDANN